MTTRIDLGNGQFADVKNVEDLRDEDRTAVNAAIEVRVDPDTKEVFVPGDREDRMRRALLCRIITGWNLQFPLPSKRPDSLGKLTIGQMKLLREGVKEHFAIVTETDEDDEAVPTESDSSLS